MKRQNNLNKNIFYEIIIEVFKQKIKIIYIHQLITFKKKILKTNINWLILQENIFSNLIILIQNNQLSKNHIIITNNSNFNNFIIR
jgi:hypothetical protein